MTEEERLERTLEAFDAANARDPNLERAGEGTVPHELADALRVHRWVLRLDPQASTALLLASRCQHLRRWEIPRSSYPAGRAGYLRWRKRLREYHARCASDILEEMGWPAGVADQVRQLNLKSRLGQAGDIQTLEDALCLAFLESEYPAFLSRTSPDRMAGILAKTWRKMSPRGRRHALGLPLEGRAKALLGEALASEAAGGLEVEPPPAGPEG